MLIRQPNAPDYPPAPGIAIGADCGCELGCELRGTRAGVGLRVRVAAQLGAFVHVFTRGARGHVGALGAAVPARVAVGQCGRVGSHATRMGDWGGQLSKGVLPMARPP